MDENFLTSKEVMKRYKIGHGTLNRMLHDKTFPAGIRLRGARRWPVSQLLEWEKEQASKSA